MIQNQKRKKSRKLPDLSELSLSEVNELVGNSYDIIGYDYHITRNIHKIDKELKMFSELLPKTSRVLDAGSGSGIPASKFISEYGHVVTGIDISETMLMMAKKNVPSAEFINMDIHDLKFEDSSFDGIISIFTLFHSPRTSHQTVFKEFHRVLKQGGILMINQGSNGMNGVSRFFGENMIWSNYPPMKTLELIKNLGFEIKFEGNLIRGGERQYWIVARKR